MVTKLRESKKIYALLWCGLFLAIVCCYAGWVLADSVYPAGYHFTDGFRCLKEKQYTESRLHSETVLDVLGTNHGYLLAIDESQGRYLSVESRSKNIETNSGELRNIYEENQKKYNGVVEQSNATWNEAVAYCKERYTCYYIWDGVKLEYGPDAAKDIVGKERPEDYLSGTRKMILYYPSELLKAGETSLQKIQRTIKISYVFLAAGLLFQLIFLVLLVLAATKKRWTPKYYEVTLLAVLAGAVSLFFVLTHVLVIPIYSDRNLFSGVVRGGVIPALPTIVCLWGLGSLILKCRKREWGRSYWCLYQGKEAIRSRMTGEKYRDCELEDKNKKRFRFTGVVCAVLAAAGVIFVILGWFVWRWLGIFGLLFAFYFICRAVLTYRDGTDAIIREIEEISAEEQLQAERMKVELVTNVSHDLKTPLTSIISYIELLEKEEMSDAARDYVKVLADKSDRLKKMVEDIFLLSKVSSGNMPVEKAPVDTKKLLIQTLADMEYRIEKSPVKIVPEYDEDTRIIENDGQKLYRVLQNLIDNALKYGMSGTRVHIRYRLEKNSVRIEIKNVASYEMDFDEEEIVKRFIRGDRARSTEGSGLGLAIAKEMTELCGGKMEIAVDGDVFKVTLSLA